MTALEDVKTYLGITDTAKDDLLNSIISTTESRLKNLLGGAESVPEELAYIVTEVSVIRYNRIGSEGVSSHSVEGESMSWSAGDFDAYEDDIQAYIDRQESESAGKVVFI